MKMMDILHIGERHTDDPRTDDRFGLLSTVLAFARFESLEVCIYVHTWYLPL